MSSLKQFLKERAEEQRVGGVQQAEIRREWIESVGSLVSRLEGWLREADTEGVLSMERISRRIVERPIGIYEAPGLKVILGPREVRIEPIARFSIGSMAGDSLGTGLRSGRVDITNSERKYMLFRQCGEVEAEAWMIVDDHEYRGQPLTRDRFEAAIQSLLE